MNLITCGVPQGSTLGPLLFIIYVNDLPFATKLQVRLFADDTNITASNQHKDTLEKIVNKELKNISNWMKLNKLTINYKKTEYIIITNKKEKTRFKVKIDENVISHSTCIKYLGVVFDDSLNWKPQINNICSKLASGCWALYQLRPYVNLQTLMMIYYSLIYSHLNYCISSWGSTSSSTLGPLNKLQKKSVKIITNSSIRTHSKPLFLDLKLLKLEDIYKFEMAKLMHRIHYKLFNISSSESNKLVMLDQTHSYNTRQKNQKNYFLNRVRTTKSQKSIQYIGAKIWNQLPKEIKQINSFKFKKELKNLLLKQYSKS